jgi:hypothetical protein
VRCGASGCRKAAIGGTLLCRAHKLEREADPATALYQLRQMAPEVHSQVQPQDANIQILKDDRIMSVPMHDNMSIDIATNDFNSELVSSSVNSQEYMEPSSKRPHIDNSSLMTGVEL